VCSTCRLCSAESQDQLEISVFTMSKINAHQKPRPKRTSPHLGLSRVRQGIEVGQRQSRILVSGEESSDVQNKYGRTLSGLAETCGWLTRVARMRGYRRTSGLEAEDSRNVSQMTKRYFSVHIAGNISISCTSPRQRMSIARESQC
jgi:hypothetical protein